MGIDWKKHILRFLLVMEFILMLLMFGYVENAPAMSFILAVPFAIIGLILTANNDYDY